MQLSKLFILGLSFVLVSELAFAYNWPFKEPNKQVPIWGVLGEFRPVGGGAFERFHKGVDLIKEVDTPVYSVQQGRVAKPPGGESLYILIPPLTKQ